jgi:hypothetical protein
MFYQRCRTFRGFRRSDFAMQTLLRRSDVSGEESRQQRCRLTSHGVEVSLGLFLQFGRLPFHPVSKSHSSWSGRSRQEIKAYCDSRPVPAFLFGKLSVDGPLNLTRLLHDLRPSSGRCLLETVSRRRSCLGVIRRFGRSEAGFGKANSKGYRMAHGSKHKQWPLPGGSL